MHIHEVKKHKLWYKNTKATRWGGGAEGGEEEYVKSGQGMKPASSGTKTSRESS